MCNSDDKFDIIIIGSGMGALASASILAQLQKKRVLVLERHFKLGGFTHAFRRKGKYDWDVGLHYVGEMQKGSPNRAMFDYVTGGKVQWHKMPDTYDKFVYPDFTFEARTGEQTLEQDLQERFPEEKDAISKYFIDVKKMVSWFLKYSMSRSLPKTASAVVSFLNRRAARLALMSTTAYLDQNFKDPKLKAVLVSQWGDYGLPPAMSAFAIHALVTSHYFNGGYYPVGGAQTIAKSVVPIVEKSGGQMLVNHEVKEVIVKDGRAVGVKATHRHGKVFTEKEYFAETVISDAGAYITYKQLLPKEINFPFAAELEHFPKGVANVTLYLGLKDDPRQAGFQGENYWIYESYDHNRIFARRNEVMEGKIGHCFLSFPSLKNPNAKSHTAELIAFMDYEPFEKWAEQPWKNRDGAYESLKEKISDALVDFTDRQLKGIKEMIDYRELSTPLSTEFMTGHTNGTIYGLPAIPERYKLKWLGIRTSIKNLYLTGADASGHGIVGAMMGGAAAAGLATGAPLSVIKIFREAHKFSRSLN